MLTEVLNYGEKYDFEVQDFLKILCLYLTPAHRHSLILACVKGMRAEREKQPDKKHRRGIPQEIATMIGVEKQTILRWISNGIQGNNPNIFTLLIISLEYARDETIKVLEECYIEHERAYNRILTEIFYQV